MGPRESQDLQSPSPIMAPGLIYFDIAAFQNFKVSLLLPQVYQDFVRESIATKQ